MNDYSELPGTKKLRLQEWLKQKLDSNEIAGVEWTDRQNGWFKIPWKHGSRHGWNVQADAEIFRQWAIHSGKYRQDKLDPVKWKTNFRCALNACPNIRKESRLESSLRGSKDYKLYKMRKTCFELKTQQKAIGKKRIQNLDLTDKQIVQMLDDMMSSSHTYQKPSLMSPRPNSACPAFETLVVDKTRDMFPISCTTPWFLWAWNAMAVDQFVHKPTDNPEGKAAKDIPEKALKQQDKTNE